MAYTAKDWNLVRAYYERGLSLSEIVSADDVVIKSRSQISKRAAKEGWEKSPEKKQLIDAEVKAKQDLKAIKETKETLKETELIVHNKLVNERLSHADFFTNAAIQNVREALEAQCEGQQDFKYRAETIIKGKETVLGKQPDTAIQINNGQMLAEMNKEQFRSEARRLINEV
jgi:predicted DNA-binding protein YlxM (UPF0122 family)